MKKLLICLPFLLAIFKPAISQEFNIKNFGAVPDGKTVSTKAIQKAIDACNAAGGGTVLIPAGEFLSGTINLKSNINFHLENGSILKGSPNLKDYFEYTMPEYGVNHYGMIYTSGAENVSITGMGTIDGNSAVFFDWDKAKVIDDKTKSYTRQKENYRKVESGIGDGPVVPKDRPRQMVVFTECKNVQVRDVSLINSPFWTLHFADCDAILVNGIKLWSNLLVPNADGVDFTSCNNVRVSDCDIRAGDDALVISGYNHHFEIPGFKHLRHISENFTITNCNLQSASSGIRIGFLDQNSVRNIQVSNINITNSTRGIGIFLRDEGSLENINFSNIYIETRLRTGDWWGNGEPIHISAIRGNEGVKLGTIRNITFDNVSCKSENGILIYGTDESIIKDVSFNRLNLQMTAGKLNNVAGGNIDLRGVNGEQNQIFKSDISAIYAQQVNGIQLDNVNVSWDKSIKESYFTNAFTIKNFEDLQLKNFKGTSSPSNPSLKIISLKGGENAEVEALKNQVETQNVKELKFIK
ncbi:hypothetical protein GS399_02330 [Pedobacter sp. HMF7647]|uniref:Glycoside hydrolase family 28 protein n=1 Tax=Hufsiella arboris TaxID=2695275 RepID=A0A7K1Y5V7_9SPHI|nr:glycosyl hydrolase family 28 protein [Hufsiella arboris]MXV49791.1 hypothetical protein [Hufsiella arboris]